MCLIPVLAHSETNPTDMSIRQIQTHKLAISEHPHSIWRRKKEKEKHWKICKQKKTQNVVFCIHVNTYMN